MICTCAKWCPVILIVFAVRLEAIASRLEAVPNIFFLPSRAACFGWRPGNVGHVLGGALVMCGKSSSWCFLAVDRDGLAMLAVHVWFRWSCQFMLDRVLVRCCFVFGVVSCCCAVCLSVKPLE